MQWTGAGGDGMKILWKAPASMARLIASRYVSRSPSPLTDMETLTHSYQSGIDPPSPSVGVIIDSSHSLLPVPCARILTLPIRDATPTSFRLRLLLFLFWPSSSILLFGVVLLSPGISISISIAITSVATSRHFVATSFASVPGGTATKT